MEDLYLTASPEVIIIRRRMVSRGQEAIPAPVVTVHPRRKEARKLPSRGPTRRTETTVETGDTIGSEGLLVDIYQAVELTLTTSLCVLVIVGKTGTGVIEGVDEEEGSGTSSTTGSQVTSHPLSISITLLLESEHRLVGVTEREVKSLCWEITDDVDSVSSPERSNTFLCSGTLEALGDTIVLAVKTASLQHLILVLDQQLNTLDRSSSGLRDGGGNTTHQEIDNEGRNAHDGLLLWGFVAHDEDWRSTDQRTEGRCWMEWKRMVSPC